MHPIDYSKVARAVELYYTQGFQNIEVPWIVDVPILSITQPKHSKQFQVDEVEYDRDKDGGFLCTAGIGGLVGSAEQGFLQIRDKLKPNKKYVASSPCFRSEPVLVEGLYQRQFFKVELMVANPFNAEYALDETLSYAWVVMSRWTFDLRVVPTTEGRDLYIGDVEVGSYGIRKFDGFQWVYGTGLALPRFDYAIRRLESSTFS